MPPPDHHEGGSFEFGLVLVAIPFLAWGLRQTHRSGEIRLRHGSVVFRDDSPLYFSLLLMLHTAIALVLIGVVVGAATGGVEIGRREAPPRPGAGEHGHP